MVYSIENSENTNLTFLERSRKKVNAGDVFVFQILDGPYRFGRVMRANIIGAAPAPGSNLLYIYKAESVDMTAPLSELTREQLLIPPIFTNRQGWLRGYFKTVATAPVKDDDWLQNPCFWDPARERYVDDRGEPVLEVHEPCGQWGIASHRGGDDDVSLVLGIAEAID